jgi:hypothetical protein
MYTSHIAPACPRSVNTDDLSGLDAILLLSFLALNYVNKITDQSSVSSG